MPICRPREDPWSLPLVGQPEVEARGIATDKRPQEDFLGK